MRSNDPAGSVVDDRPGSGRGGSEGGRPGMRASCGRARFRSVRLRIDADDRHALAPEIDGLRLVAQQLRLLEVLELGGPRERVSRDGDVVVAEHDEGPVEPGEQPSQARSRRAGCETRSPVTQTRSGRSCGDPRRGTRARSVAARESGAPRWKSERWPILRPSSAPGGLGHGLRGRVSAATRPPASRRRTAAAATQARTSRTTGITAP